MPSALCSIKTTRNEIPANSLSHSGNLDCCLCLAYLNTLQDLTTREDILKLLGDTEDRKFPIWRSGSDNEYTLCTAFFDLQAETVEVIFDNPKKGLERGIESVLLPLRAKAGTCLQ